MAFLPFSWESVVGPIDDTPFIDLIHHYVKSKKSRKITKSDWISYSVNLLNKKRCFNNSPGYKGSARNATLVLHGELTFFVKLRKIKDII